MVHQGPDGSDAHPGQGSPPLLDGMRELGSYKLLSTLGEGGMGIVYLAEQTAPLRRRVAIKVLKPGMDSEQILARFESERQALAVMDHPNIAKVFHSGLTASGRPYFAMEVVHGTPITHYADTHRLNTSERLRLFLGVCGAVQHAHLKGVIHRDLKPSNVLVSIGDAGPIVNVIDFGIAKAIGMGLTDRTILTRAGQQLGTPEYMSPEQAEMSGLDVDTRSDIYSLGVMLYELTVGARPFELSNRPGYVIPHALREREVPRPSTRLTGLGETLETVARHRRTTPESLRRELRGDLDWIILKAMDKDRTRRYDTASGLALDLKRHLDHEPVRARPPSAAYRVGKFVRRNRAGVVAAGVAIIALLGGAAAATVGYVQADRQRVRAERAAATASQVSGFLVDLFRVNDPSEARGNTITARELLDRGAETIVAELADQPVVQVRLMGVMGDAYRSLGLFDQAIELLENAVAIGDRAPIANPLERAGVLERLGRSYGPRGRIEDAATAFERARELAGAGTTEYADATVGLGRAHMALARYDEAEELLLEALRIREATVGSDHLDVAEVLEALGAMHLQMRQHIEAEPYLLRARAIMERKLPPDHTQLLSLLTNLTAVDRYFERYDEAEAALRRLLPLWERVLPPFHRQIATVLHNIGDASWKAGRVEEAEEPLERALDIKERALSPADPSLGQTLHVLANVYRDQGRLSDAAPLYIRALAIYDASLGEADPRRAELLQEFAHLRRLQERHVEAAEMDERLSRDETPQSLP